jgi:hypothetical protein
MLGELDLDGFQVSSDGFLFAQQALGVRQPGQELVQSMLELTQCQQGPLQLVLPGSREEEKALMNLTRSRAKSNRFMPSQSESTPREAQSQLSTSSACRLWLKNGPSRGSSDEIRECACFKSLLKGWVGLLMPAIPATQEMDIIV